VEEVSVAPYPADTRAKGWRFELDLDRVRQSDTWALAAPDVRPWLLMLWATAWEQTPCGSLPGDDVLIAARIGASPKFFAKHKAVLLRGWVLADDGRMYHQTITELVLAMTWHKDAERRRKSEYRARLSHGTDVGRTPESSGSDATGTGTSTKEIQNPPTPSGVAPPCDPGPKSKAPPKPDDVDAQTWADWLALRKAKRAPVTATVVDGAKAEAGKAGLSLEAFLRVWCARGSQGLQAEWLKPDERGATVQRLPALTAAERRVMAEMPRELWAPHLRELEPPKPTMEIFDVTARALG
jgi:hypothetical protein